MLNFVKKPEKLSVAAKQGYDPAQPNIPHLKLYYQGAEKSSDKLISEKTKAAFRSDPLWLQGSFAMKALETQ